MRIQHILRLLNIEYKTITTQRYLIIENKLKWRYVQHEVSI